jgi:rod shape-determining protein MreC
LSGLIAFLFRLRFLFLFFALEGLAGYMIVAGNTYQRVQYLNTSNRTVAKVYEQQSQVQEYFALSGVNNDLAQENAMLRTQLMQFARIKEAGRMDSLMLTMRDSLAPDTLGQYKYVVAKVINNSVSRINNYLTLNRGSEDGVLPGMGVVAPSGAVGKVRNVSPHFSTVTSLLHSKLVISAEIGRTRAFGTVKWKGINPQAAQLLYIARHLKPKVGDTVVTSSLSSVFPQGIMVGRITRVSIRDDDTFFSIDVDLSANFGTLEYVYVAENLFKTEQDTLEARLPKE